MRQSEHLSEYREVAARLAAMGLLYPCFASRQEIQAAAVSDRLDPDGAPLYPGRHRHLGSDEIERRKARGEPFALRLDMARAVEMAHRIGGTPLSFTELDENLHLRTVEANPARWGDVVIQRKETSASYHLAVVVDDARQSITHVVRGQDLRAATDIHRLLQVLLGFPAPLYHHHRLILDPAGRKLSKRDGDTALAILRDRGLVPSDIVRMVGLEEDEEFRSFTCL